MEQLPIVAICGRPNVGKSTLFNALAHRKISIVDPTSGVTRDRISTIVETPVVRFELVDTGGLGIEAFSDFGDEVAQQVYFALDQAQLILFVVDIQDGLNPLDQNVAEILRKHHNKKNIWFLANKTDSPHLENSRGQFARLGFGEPTCISTAHNYGVRNLEDELCAFLAKEYPECKPSAKDRSETISLAIVGKPNAGKSTLINCLAEEERVIVSETPGTTRDSVDVHFEKDGKKIIAIDTAGLKRPKNLRDNVEFYSQHRSERSIRRADVVILMLDASDKITKVDKQIASYIREENKPLIISVNKWDLAKKIAHPTDYETYVSKLLPGLDYAPMIFMTAKSGKNVGSTIDLARSIYKQSKRRVSTGELNRFIQDIVDKKSPPVHKGKIGKIYYATQAKTSPPTFVFFVNYPKIFKGYYQRYIFNQFQTQLGFTEIPVKLQFRSREMKKNRS